MVVATLGSERELGKVNDMNKTIAQLLELFWVT